MRKELAETLEPIYHRIFLTIRGTGRSSIGYKFDSNVELELIEQTIDKLKHKDGFKVERFAERSIVVGWGRWV